MKIRAVIASVLLLPAVGALADTVALTSNRTIGNQSFTGALGMDFNVLSPILVTHLGAFDSAQDGFRGAVQVGIFNRDNQALVGVSATLTGTTQPLLGNSRYADVVDFVLPQGNYSIVAVGFSSGDPNGNLNLGGAGPSVDNGNGAIAFVGSSRWATTGVLTFPLTSDSGSSTLYDAGTFRFTTAVPEAGTAWMLIAGFAFLGIACRRSGCRRA
jgi:hypothetical protein